MGTSEGDFTGKAELYSKYRPTYPKEIVKLLNEKYGLTRDMIVADVGCGTGALSVIFLNNGNKVICVEPNQDMLTAARNLLSKYEKVIFVEGSAESTRLNDNSVDVIIAGQSFHWFDEEKAGREFRRILKSNNFVVLIWNDRDMRDPFTYRYEEFVREFSKGYRGTGSTAIPSERIHRFLNNSYDYYEMDNFQKLNLEGLIGRYLSVTYSLKKDDPEYERAISSLHNLYEENQKNGEIRIKYTTKVFVGRIK